MRKLKLTRARQEQFLKALAETGSVATSAALAGTSRTRVYELRKADPAFASAWEDAEEIAADRLEEEARRRAVEGVEEPLVSGGKLVRDDNGQPITVRRYSDNLLLALAQSAPATTARKTDALSTAARYNPRPMRPPQSPRWQQQSRPVTSHQAKRLGWQRSSKHFYTQ